MKTALLLLPATAMLAACHQPADWIQVTNPWVRLAAVPANPSAAYFTLKNGPRDKTLVAVSTPAATRAEMHESMNSGGMMTMAPLKLVAVRAGGEVTFAPGGKHVMLYGLKAAAGGTVPLTFTFGDGRKITANARVVSAGDPAPE